MNKQIEEMAKVICQECLTATEEENCQNEVKDCMAYEYAKLFYNAGYRKVVYNDVSMCDLLNEEMQSLMCGGKVCFTADELVEQTNDLVIQIEQTRKETAREILSWAERVAKPTYYNVDDNPRMESLVLLSDIYKFFKEKLGIEVE